MTENLSLDDVRKNLEKDGLLTPRKKTAEEILREKYLKFKEDELSEKELLEYNELFGE